MIISIEWLKQFVDIEETPEKLSEMLTMLGLESDYSKTKYSMVGVVIGQIRSVKKHSNAEKLNICNVYDGKQNHQVVCGAPNVDNGQLIAFARIGSVLPGNIKIRKINIRGVESSGMICSEKELFISDEHDGIMILPAGLEIGSDFMEAYGNNFQKLTLDITPNRADAFSHLGVARDIACKTNRNFTGVSVKKTLNKENSEKINITIENNTDCPRYIGGVIKNINVGPSPKWLQDRLKACGQRSINNIVDVSNYVLMEMGHPNHIFDYESFRGKSIHIRRAKNKESLITLDEQKHELDENNLVITDGEKPVALAGIMGGLYSSVSYDTKSIFLESAFFNPILTRKSSKNIGLYTEASKRYERGVDINNCEIAFWRVVNLLESIAGGKLASSMIDIYPEPFELKKVKVSKVKLNLVLGLDISDSIVERILIGLEFQVTKIEIGWSCTVPSFRPDITREIDIIEEIARVYGYDRIPSNENLYGTFRYDNLDPENYLDSIRNTFTGAGFHQIYSNSLQNKVETHLSQHSPLKMLNPLNENMSFLRTSLLPGLLKIANYNKNHGIKSFRLYELGNVHSKNGDGLENIIERRFLSGLIYGLDEDFSVHSKPRPENIFSLKGYLSLVFEKKLKFSMTLMKGVNNGFQICREILINNHPVGHMGEISKEWIKTIGLDLDSIFGFEINLDPLKKMINQKKTYSDINTLPMIARDLNLVIPQDQEVEQLQDLFFRKGKKIIKTVKPVNIFIDDSLGAKNMKSVTFKILFQSSAKTLEDKDVNQVIDEIIDVAKKKFFAKLRT